MNIAQQYIKGLKQAYYENNGKQQWDDFAGTVQGVNSEVLERLRTLYPDIPNSLVQLLEIVDGTYWRNYGNGEIAFFFLGSDLEEYPYYLLSAEQMMDPEEFDWLKDYINREYEDLVEIDEKITDNAEQMCWLHFSDCMNNGGTSQLFIDFSPSAKGTKGQIVRYLHDPDEIAVIADSFEEYLQMLMDNEYDFITEDVIEE